MKSISAPHLNDNLNEYVILDVREPHEVACARIDPHIHIPMASIPARQNELNKDTPIVIICHTGARSAQVCYFLKQQGFDVTNLEGGIDAWSRLVAPGIPRY